MKWFELLNAMDQESMIATIDTKKNLIGIFPNYLTRLRRRFPDIDDFIVEDDDQNIMDPIVWVKPTSSPFSE